MKKKFVFRWRRFISLLLVCMYSAFGYAQNSVKISGTVVDGSGEELVGVSISIKGTTSGTVTDINGAYTIDVPGTQSVLQFSYIGYIPQFVTVENRKVINVILKEDVASLDEVVVIGYGTSRKKDITGSVASVKAGELNSISSSSVSQMLQGKVSGMNVVQNSAQPGAGISITIRGAASPSGSNAPLYVIDGVPLQTNSTADPGVFGVDYKTGVDRDPLNSINPNDIESIEVLKDASAAAIYGASAANGVILITTKSGKNEAPKVEWRSVATTQIRKAYPEVHNALSFREQVNFWNKEYYLYNNKMGIYGDKAVDYSGWNPIFADVNAYQYNTDWVDEVSRNGYIIDQNLSVNGGTDKTKYFFSYNYYDNEGILVQSGLQRNSIRLNLDQQFGKIFKAGVKITYSNLIANSTTVGDVGEVDNMISDAFVYAPDKPILDADGNYARTYNPLVNNPVSFKEIEDKTVTDRIFIAPTFDLKLFDGLTLRGVGGFDKQSSVRKFYIPVKANRPESFDGMANLGHASAINMSAESFLNYEKTFDAVHRVSAVLGAGYYKTSSDYFGMAAFDFFTDAFGYDNVGIATNKEMEQLRSGRSERTKLSQFVRLNYSFADRYIATVTARRDGSSYFAENNKWGVFPSASVAWRLSEEAFLQGNQTLSDLKIRVGYGATGNENVIGTNSMAAYQSGYNTLIGNTVHTGLALTRVSNPNLKWETDYTSNVGIDFGFFNQRISGSLDFFHRGAKDLLDYQQLPANNAVGRVAANIGSTMSEGVEFSLRSYNLNSTPLKWETTLNISYFKAKWVERNPEVALAEYIGPKGDLDAIYGWETDGIITSKADIPDYMPDAFPGNVKYVDQNNDNVLDSKDVVKLGNSSPDFVVGLGNTLSYKGFDFNFYFYGSFGNLKQRGQTPDLAALGAYGAPGNTFVNSVEAWNSQTETGWRPGIATNPYDASNPTGTNDFNLMNGAFVRLKNITLGYTLPTPVFADSKWIRGARFFVDAQNVAVFTGYEGFDPELGVNNPYPQALSLSFGFNLNF